ncbi:MAG: acyl-CoA dehydrogenase family protein [Myxococcota bacterium]|nr:acyl-CoA dehydrogenase family protein [Myxococcota bacterium]
MDTRFSDEDEKFRGEIAGWLEANLKGEFEIIRGRGGPGDEHAFLEERLAWERKMAEGGWTAVAWPKEYGGRDLSLNQQVIFYEEYARVGGPGRANHVGEGLLGPTVIAFGTDEQKAKFLPGIVNGTEIWCQGYSEPNAGSDLANVQTKARLENGEWIIDGQKVWTSWGEWADWCFVVTRTDPDSLRHKGLSYLLVPMDQEGVDARPIEQLTGTSEFCEVFFNEARTAEENIVGDPGQGWSVAMGTLDFERGVSTLGQQMLFANEFAQIVAIAKRNGKAEDPVMRQRLADAWIGLQIMRYNALRTLSSNKPGLSREATITKIYWATWHRDLGKLFMDVMGPEGEIAEGFPYELSQLQRMYLFVRSDTIYAGSNQIQRNIISERALGMPREARP